MRERSANKPATVAVSARAKVKAYPRLTLVPADVLSVYDRDVTSNLESAVAARFVATNGDHPMTPDDDAYVSEWFTALEELATEAGERADELRRRMLTNRLPLPSYIRSDGAQMVPRDLLELPDRAGGFDELPEYFAAHFDAPAQAVSEWDAYLAGHFVCLRSVTPENITRKGELVAAIETELAQPQPDSAAWLERLHELVDELDALEPPFAPYDRLRFGGPVSRDRLIDDVRERFATQTMGVEEIQS
jgi:hypothetical protein